MENVLEIVHLELMLQVNHAYLVTQIVEVAMQDLVLIVILAETLESYSKVHV